MEINVIASVKYGKKRIGRYGIYAESCLAEARHQLEKYLGNVILARGYLFDYKDQVEKQKNYVQCEGFKII